MSDFLFSTHRRSPGELQRILNAYLGPVTAELAEYHGAWGSLAVARAPHDAPPVLEEGGWLSVLVGEPIVRIPPAAPGMASDPSLRDSLHERVVTGAGPAWDEGLDGPFVLLGIDTMRSRGVVVTDLLSSIPAFHAASPQGMVVGTHVDAVAVAAGRHEDLDLVSAADLLIHLSMTFPFTLYQGVEQLTPAAVRGFSHAGWDGEGKSYWQPLEQELYPSPSAAAEALREGLVESVRIACSGRPTVGLLLSAGEDSRAVLGAVPPDSKVRGFVFADWENREIAIARKVARAYGAEVVFGARGPDHYLDHFEAVARMVGSIQLFSDVHGYGFHESLRLSEMPVVLGGFSADSLVKSSYVPKRDPRPGGVAWSEAPLGRATLPGIRADLAEAARKRRHAYRARIGELRPESAGEWFRLWPFSMRKHAANLHGNRRLFRTHEPFHSNRIVKLAAGVSQQWKANRRLYHAAVRPLLARSWYITHSKPRLPYFGHRANLFLWLGIGLARGVRAVLTGGIRSHHGPWPKWKRLTDSEAMAALTTDYSLSRSPLGAVLEPGSTEEQERTVREDWSALRRLLALQLVYLAEVGSGTAVRPGETGTTTGDRE